MLRGIEAPNLLPFTKSLKLLMMRPVIIPLLKKTLEMHRETKGGSMHNFTQIALDLLFDKLDASDSVKNQENNGQKAVNCDYYEKSAREFANDILYLLKSEEVFVEFVYCDFKR